jgi:hypothetical protein
MMISMAGIDLVADARSARGRDGVAKQSSC